MTVQLLGADESRPGVRESVQATLDLLRGLGVASLLTDDSARRAPAARRVEPPAHRRPGRDGWCSR